MPTSDSIKSNPSVSSLAVAVLLAILSSIQISTTAEAEELRFGFHGTQCPVVCDPGVDGQHGYVIDILREIGRPAGVGVTLKVLPKTRLVRELNAGNLDFLLLPPTAVKKYNLVSTSLPVVYYAIGVLRRRDFPFEFSGVESLEKVVWGVVGGERWRPAYQRYIEANKNKGVIEVFGAKPFERLIKMMVRNRVDVVIGLYDMLERKRTDSASAEKLTVERTMVFGKHVPIYLAFSPNNDQAISRSKFFSEGIRRLAQTGRLKQIFAAYDIGDWAQIDVSSFED